MTTPGQQLTPGDDQNPPTFGVPEGAYVGDAGAPNAITDLNTLNEEEAKRRMQAATAPSFTAQRDAAWGVFNDIAYAITGVRVDENGNPIQHIEDWAVKDLHNVGAVIEDYGTALEELGQNRVMPWAVPTVAPLSQSINRRADPTFQLSDLMSPLMRGRSDTENHNHTHITTSEPYQMQRGMDTKGRIYYAFITPAVTRAYTQLNFMVSEVTSPCRMDIAVYVVDSERNLERQVHQTDVLATLGIGEAVVTANFGTFVADQGSYLAVAFLQHGAGNARSILGLDDTPRPLTGAVFPPKISATNQVTGRTSLPATIDGNIVQQVDFSGYWFTPYAELSEDVGIDYKMFSEAWGSGSVATRPWVGMTSSGIFSSANGWAMAGGDGQRVSIYDTPLSTDYVRVRTSISRHQTDNNYPSTLIFRGTNNLRSGLGLAAVNKSSSGGGYYKLTAWSNEDVTTSWDSGRTTLATIARLPQQGDQIEVDYLNGLVTVRINGDVRIDSMAVGGPAGAAGRFVGLQFEGGSNLFNTWRSPYFGPWSARDLPQENGDEGDDEDEGPIVGD